MAAKWKIEEKKNGFGTIVGINIIQYDGNGKIINEKELSFDPVAKNGLKFDNAFTKGNAEQFIKGLEHYLNNEKFSSKEEFKKSTGLTLSDKEWENIYGDIKTTLNTIGINPDTYDPKLGGLETGEEPDSTTPEQNQDGKWKLKEELGDSIVFEKLDENGKSIDTKEISIGGSDGFKFNNWLGITSGSKEQLIKGMEVFLNEGEFTDKNDFIRKTGLTVSDRQWENIKSDMELAINKMGIDPTTYEPELGRSKTPEEIEKEIEETTKAEVLNPYEKYLENQRQRMESAELGLMTEQNQIAKQNADIAGQQSMMQQGQFKDQLIEQIKSDRLSKMRSGLTPMQIAQEELQFMVGNQQANAQQMSLVNQQRLGAVQNQRLTPYQAYLNSVQGVTGGQGYGNIATGFAATDAGDLYQQALRLARSRRKEVPTLDEFNTVQGKLD